LQFKQNRANEKAKSVNTCSVDSSIRRGSARASKHSKDFYGTKCSSSKYSKCSEIFDEDYFFKACSACFVTPLCNTCWMKRIRCSDCFQKLDGNDYVEACVKACVVSADNFSCSYFVV
jgi:hypothetical protein